MPVRWKPDRSKYRDAILKIGRHALGRDAVTRVLVEDDIDSDGQACLSITFVLKNEQVLDSRGSQLNGITVAVIDMLRNHDDGRFPFTHYVTAEELHELETAHD
jgi:hypothetical protein